MGKPKKKRNQKCVLIQVDGGCMDYMSGGKVAVIEFDWDNLGAEDDLKQLQLATENAQQIPWERARRDVLERLETLKNQLMLSGQVQTGAGERKP